MGSMAWCCVSNSGVRVLISTLYTIHINVGNELWKVERKKVVAGGERKAKMAPKEQLGQEKGQARRRRPRGKGKRGASRGAGATRAFPKRKNQSMGSSNLRASQCLWKWPVNHLISHAAPPVFSHELSLSHYYAAQHRRKEDGSKQHSTRAALRG